MADLGPALGAIGELAAPLLGRALRAFLATTFGMFALGCVVATGSMWFLWDKGLKFGLLGGLGAMACFALAGFGLAGQRAVGSALLEGLRRAALGSRVVQAVFDALAETRGAQALERLPLAQAEKMLHDVIHKLLSAPAAGGGLKASLGRKLRASLLEKVEKLTVARFRAEPEGSDARGGIDVQKVGAELALKADDALANQVLAVMKKATISIVLGACLVQCLWVAFLWNRPQ